MLTVVPHHSHRMPAKHSVDAHVLPHTTHNVVLAEVLISFRFNGRFPSRQWWCYKQNFRYVLAHFLQTIVNMRFTNYTVISIRRGRNHWMHGSIQLCTTVFHCPTGFITEPRKPRLRRIELLATMRRSRYWTQYSGSFIGWSDIS